MTLREIREELEKKPKIFFVIIGIIIIWALHTVDYFFTPGVAFSLLYWIPVSMATWFSGIWGGVIVALSSSLGWAIHDYLKGINFQDPVRTIFLELGFLLVGAYILANLKKSLEVEKTFAETDPLTKVGNWRWFMKKADYEIKRSTRYKRVLSLLYLDVDNFKEMNDTYGHITGNELLTLIGCTIRNHTRKTDIAARLGGDEFAVLLPETEEAQATIVALKLKDILDKAMKATKWPVTFSFGIVTFQQPPANVDDLVRLADEMMYEAKDKGKNTIKTRVFKGYESERDLKVKQQEDT